MSYEQLDGHLDYCSELVRSGEETQREVLDRLDRHVVELDEDLTRRIGELEARIDRVIASGEEVRPTEATSR